MDMKLFEDWMQMKDPSLLKAARDYIADRPGWDLVDGVDALDSNLYGSYDPDTAQKELLLPKLLSALSNILTEEQLDAQIPAINYQTLRDLLKQARRELNNGL